METQTHIDSQGPKKVPNAEDSNNSKELDKNASQAESEKKEGSPESEEEGLRIKLAEIDNKYRYLYAEFENYKKRSAKERSDLLKFGWESLAHELLGVLDNFERALEHAPQDLDKGFLEGVKMVHHQLLQGLTRKGVEPFETKGKKFDPEKAEAIETRPSEEPEGFVLAEQLKGYTLHGRLLRAARVVVSQGPETASGDTKKSAK